MFNQTDPTVATLLQQQTAGFLCSKAVWGEQEGSPKLIPGKIASAWDDAIHTLFNLRNYLWRILTSTNSPATKFARPRQRLLYAHGNVARDHVWLLFIFPSRGQQIRTSGLFGFLWKWDCRKMEPLVAMSAPINTFDCDVKSAQRVMMGHTIKSHPPPPPGGKAFCMTKTLKGISTSCKAVRMIWL